MTLRQTSTLFWCSGLLWIGAAEATEMEPQLTIMETKTGVQFGLWGCQSDQPSPTLFILASSIEATLEDSYYRQSGNALSKEGYLCVAIDIPGHGLQHRSDEPDGLAGWRYRTDRGENFVAETNQRLKEVLDFLIEEGYANPAKIAVCGTSRGGFLAMHFAASDVRVKCVATFAPVTDLIVLREFYGAEDDRLVTGLSVSAQADRLASRPVWIVIGDRDERVGTDNAIALARRITASALAQGLPAAVELHVLPEPKGHTTPAGAPERAARWIHEQIETKSAIVSDCLTQS